MFISWEFIRWKGSRGARQGFGTSYLFNTALKKANAVLGGTREDVSLAGITAIVRDGGRLPLEIRVARCSVVSGSPQEAGLQKGRSGSGHGAVSAPLGLSTTSTPAPWAPGTQDGCCFLVLLSDSVQVSAEGLNEPKAGRFAGGLKILGESSSG